MGFLPISKMAEIHGLSRQTLIYYDQLDFFKPVYVNEKGYRFYDETQIPFLREICFLKSIGVSLKEIQYYFQDRDPEQMVTLLEKQKEQLTREIMRLNNIRSYIQQRISRYEFVAQKEYTLNTPFIQFFSQRSIILETFPTPPTRRVLHTTLMRAWRKMDQREFSLSSGFGTLIVKDSLFKGQIMEGAGSFIFLPSLENVPEMRIISKGEFACIVRYGMPYETEAIKALYQWIMKNGYEITGDILDVCLLDTTFYKPDKKADLCMIQIPVIKK